MYILTFDTFQDATPRKRARAHTQTAADPTPAKRRGRGTSTSRQQTGGAASNVHVDKENVDKQNVGKQNAGKQNVDKQSVNEENVDTVDDNNGSNGRGDEEPDLGDLADSDVDVDEPGTKPSRKWSATDRTMLYNYLLGPDADEMYMLLQKNRILVFRRVMTIFWANI